MLGLLSHTSSEIFAWPERHKWCPSNWINYSSWCPAWWSNSCQQSEQMISFALDALMMECKALLDIQRVLRRIETIQFRSLRNYIFWRREWNLQPKITQENGYVSNHFAEIELWITFTNITENCDTLQKRDLWKQWKLFQVSKIKSVKKIERKWTR